MKITLDLDIIGPYVREDGKLVVKFVICGESFEREVDYNSSKGEYVFRDPDKVNE